MLQCNVITCNCAIAIWSRRASKQSSIEPPLWHQHDSYPPMKNDSSPSKKAPWYSSGTELPELFSALYVSHLLSCSCHFGCSTGLAWMTVMDVWNETCSYSLQRNFQTDNTEILLQTPSETVAVSANTNQPGE